MARDDEGASLIVVLKEAVEGGGDVIVRNTGNRVFNVSGLLPGFLREFKTSLTVVRHEHIGRLLEHTCVRLVFDRRASHDIGVAELG